MGWSVIADNHYLLLSGFWFTIELTVASIVTSTLLGLVVALIRYLRVPLLAQVARVYLEVFRGSPLLVQILFIYFGAAYLAIDAVTVFIAVLLALTLYQGAYVSEIFRAGLESVPAGQWEAGRTLGLPRWRILKDVVLPQTVTVVLPPLFGQYIGLVKNTSLASVIGYADLTRQGQGIIDRFGNPFLVFLVVAVGYFIISYPLSLTARSLEKRRIRKMATVS
jgi:polar amino acid transport system permease protein